MRSCMLCGSTQTRSLVERQGWRQQWPHSFEMLECADCGMIFVDPQPSDQELAAAYPEESYYAYGEHAQERSTGANRVTSLKQKVRQEVISALSSPNPLRRNLSPWAWIFSGRFSGIPVYDGGSRKRLLDVGCGDGAYLAAFRKVGWEVAGVEMSASASAKARQAGLEVYAGSFESVSVPGQFDVIRMWHVLEHVRQPQEALEKAHRLLSPTGELIVGIPNAGSFARRLCGVRWCAWDLPRHLHHFTPATIRRLLEQNRFRVSSIRHCSVGTILPSVPGKAVNNLFARAGGIALDKLLDLSGSGDSLEVRAYPC